MLINNSSCENSFMVYLQESFKNSRIYIVGNLDKYLHNMLIAVILRFFNKWAEWKACLLNWI